MEAGSRHRVRGLGWHRGEGLKKRKKFSSRSGTPGGAKAAVTLQGVGGPRSECTQGNLLRDWAVWMSEERGMQGVLVQEWWPSQGGLVPMGGKSNR